jgi:lysophospholipid acyltransferase (LPLAT)-like uncharacterized protein
MKIRNPKLIAAAGVLGTFAVRGLVKSLRTEYRHLAPGLPSMPPAPEPHPRLIFLLWHEYLILPLTRYACPEVSTLVSKHADGQILATLIKQLGLTVVSGSTNRGGVQAVREILRDISGKLHLAITPDGPRGPRRVIQQGAIYLASRTGMPISPLGVGYYRPWRAKSWDRFAVPKPCMRAKILSSEPIHVPAKLRTDGLEHYRQIVQTEMDRLSDMAEAWAETNRLPAGDGAPRTT